MSKVFTKKDIKVITFDESFDNESEPYYIYDYLKELASQDIYVVDVTLLYTKKDKYDTHNHYMIRIVRPVYDVEVKIYHYNDFTDHWYHFRTEVFEYYESEDEARKKEKEYTDKNNSDVKFKTKIRLQSPLNKPI